MDTCRRRASTATDRGLQYGDGLFETITCRDGSRAGWRCTCSGCSTGASGCDLPFQRVRYCCEPRSAALAAGQERCLVKVIVTRGAATRRGYAPAGDERADAHRQPA